MVDVNFKSCTRCGGDTVYTHDPEDTPCMVCMQCGSRRYIDFVPIEYSDPRKEKVRQYG